MTKYDFQAFEEGFRKKLTESDFAPADDLVSLALGVLEEVVREKLLTTKEAAAALGASLSTVQKMIQRGTLPADKRGRDWFIKESSLSRVKITGNGGRPRKEKEVKFKFYIPSTYTLPK